MPEPNKESKAFGAFELTRKLGRGGMGTVWEARHPNYPGPVAVKIAHVLVAEEISLSQRFYNEYSLGKQLDHPNLVKVFDYGVEDERPYLVMEYVPGWNLDQRIEANGVLSVDEALAIFEQLTTVVHFIHQKSLIHRDIKPANILIDPLGRIKLADLGLIKDQESIIPLTQSRVSLGTPDFGAPEQFDDAAHVDHRCDIYALGVTLYVALTGAYPFGRASQAAILRHKITFEFAPLSQVLLRVPPAIDQAVIRSLHPDSKMRPESALRFMEELRGSVAPAWPELRPTFPEPYQPNARDRRGRPRFALSIADIKVSLHNSEAAPIAMDIINVSVTGLCLKANRAFSIGTGLIVSLPFPEAAEPVRARVCWIHETADHHWLLGCSLIKSINEAHLQNLMDSHLPKTEVVRNAPKSDCPSEAVTGSESTN